MTPFIGARRAAALAALVLALFASPAFAAIEGDVEGFERCGQTMPVDAKTCPAGVDCRKSSVFSVDDRWHGLAQCMRAIRTFWSRGGPDKTVDIPGSPKIADLALLQIVDAMRKPSARLAMPGAKRGETVGFSDVFDQSSLVAKTPPERALLVNERDEPFNAMGQTGFGYFLYQFAALAEKGGYPRAEADATFYKTLARAALKTVVTPIDQGGLASSEPCDKAKDQLCTWYHSVTRQDRAAGAGATLNQMLHAVRDFGLVAETVKKQGWSEPIDYEAAVREGIRQLFLSNGHQGPGQSPNLDNFISPPRGADKVRWAYYGFNTERGAGKPGYFLKQAGKSCSYHVHVLDLAVGIIKRAETEDPDLARLASRCDSAFYVFLKAAKAQAENRSDPSAWSDGETDLVCSTGIMDKFERGTEPYLESKQTSCQR